MVGHCRLTGWWIRFGVLVSCGWVLRLLGVVLVDDVDARDNLK